MSACTAPVTGGTRDSPPRTATTPYGRGVLRMPNDPRSRRPVSDSDFLTRPSDPRKERAARRRGDSKNDAQDHHDGPRCG
ncbi:MAG: hypothetical protein ACK5SI_06350, partial [Planctomycetia bacterium]